MKQLRKAIVLAVLAVVMTMAVSVSAKAEGQQNTTETLTWGKNYNIEYNDGGYYAYNLNLISSGKVTFTTSTEESQWKNRIVIKNPGDNSDVWSSGHLETGTHMHSVNLLAGTYSVLIVNNFGDYYKGSMVPTFVSSGETVNENYMNKNNQLGTASSHKVGNKVSAQFAYNDDTDIYKVRISKAGYLTMSFSNQISSMNMTITCPNADITHQQQDIPLGTSKYKFFVPKGTCYITFSKDGYDGTYTFKSKYSGLTKTKVKTAKNLSGKKAKITWSKKSDVDGYQVQVAQNKKFTKGKKSKTLAVTTGWYGNNPTSHTFTKLKKGKYYYARVRTYKLVNGTKCYSDWSSVKKFKVKK